MTPKEEAKELVDMFLKEFPSTEDIGFGQIKVAKQCALICVDWIIKSQEKSNDNYGGHSLTNLEIEFYQEVKQEIIKL